jgi:PhzF family phenazine biosynthesis protein
MQRHFKQVDVFTAVPYKGNPLAVVLDGTGLSAEQMQHFTNWTNLSECTFVLPPTDSQADYKVRIFCPGRELPFAGHPTLGTAHAWMQAGGKPKSTFIVQECGIGLVKIKCDGARLAFAAPPLLKSGPLDEADVQLIARGLGLQRHDIIAHAWCDNGPKWRGVMLQSASQVLALKPDGAMLAGLDIGVVGAQAADTETQLEEGLMTHFEVRAFFPGNNGLCEDPVTGSLNAAIAQWLIGTGQAPSRYVAAQGTALARAGRVHVSQEGADIWIGGESVTCVEGTVQL